MSNYFSPQGELKRPESVNLFHVNSQWLPSVFKIRTDIPYSERKELHLLVSGWDAGKTTLP